MWEVLGAIEGNGSLARPFYNRSDSTQSVTVTIAAQGAGELTGTGFPPGNHVFLVDIATNAYVEVKATEDDKPIAYLVRPGGS